LSGFERFCLIEDVLTVIEEESLNSHNIKINKSVDLGSLNGNIVSKQTRRVWDSLEVPIYFRAL